MSIKNLLTNNSKDWLDLKVDSVDLNTMTSPNGQIDINTDIEVNGTVNGTLQCKTQESIDRIVSGFVNETDQLSSFTNSTRLFEISPVSTSFKFYSYGQLFTKTSTESVTIDPIEGIHTIYYNSSGNLTVSFGESAIGDIVKNECLVAFVYWDTTNSQQIYFSGDNSMHLMSMSGKTHYYLNETKGAVYKQGASLNTLSTDASGNLNSSAQFGVDSGEFFDEDLVIDLTPEIVTFGLQVYYLSGSAWRRSSNLGYSVLNTGTGRLAYNSVSGGVGSTLEVSNSDYVLYHIFATNDSDYQYISIMGRNIYTSQVNARQGATDEISSIITTTLPFQEFIPIASIIFQTDNSYTNDVKGRIRKTDLGDDYIDWRFSDINIASSTVNDHSSLSNLTNDDHIQYPLLNGRTGDILKIDNIEEFTVSGGINLDNNTVVTGDLEVTGDITNVGFQELMGTIGSAGYVSGCDFTDNGDGTFNVDAGVFYFKASVSDTAPLIKASVSALTNEPISTDTIVYVAADYNSGSPILTTGYTYNQLLVEQDTKFPVHKVVRNDSLSIKRAPLLWIMKNISKRLQQIQAFEDPYRRTSGLLISDTGTRNIAMTSGVSVIQLNNILHSAIDTSGADTFTALYDNGVGGCTKVLSQTQWDNLNYDDGSGTLASLGVAKYGFHEVYVDNENGMYTVYGRAQYNSSSDASAEPVLPVTTLCLDPDISLYLGRIVFQRNSSSPIYLSSFSTQFTYGTSNDHGSLAGLTDDDHSQYALLTGRSGNTLAIDDITEYTSSAGVTVEEFNFTGGEALVSGTANAYVQYQRNASTDFSGMYLGTGTNRWQIGQRSGSENLVMYQFSGSVGNAMVIDTNRDIYFPTVYAEDISGKTTRDLYIASDGQIGQIVSLLEAKTNIEDVSDVSWIYSLEPKKYNYRKVNITVDPETGEKSKEYLDTYVPQKRYGLIAEEVELVKNDICVYEDELNKTGLVGVRKNELIIPLLKAVQDLKKEIDILKGN